MPRRVILYWETGNTVVKVVLFLLFLDAFIAAYWSTL